MNYYRQGPPRFGGSGIQFGVPGLTPIVRLLIIANTAAWFAQILALYLFGVELVQFLGIIPAQVVVGQLWRPFTAMFLHSTGDLFHLVFNMLMLWMFGGELERHWGGRPFLRFYLVSGLGGAVGAVLLGLVSAANWNAVVFGASGAIFGLIIAYGMIFAERTILFMLIFPMKARTMALIMFGLTFFYTVTQRGGGVSHVSHLGGAIAGYLYLKRAWRIGDFYKDLKWKIRRRRFKILPPDHKDDFDRWIN